MIAADSLLVRAGLTRLLEEAGFAVVGQASDGDDLLRKVRGHRPDAAVIDLGVEGLRAARATSSEVGLLLLVEHVDTHSVAALMESRPAGVGVLLKARIAEPDRFADEVRRVARGDSALDPVVLAEVLTRSRGKSALDVFTLREREILAGMAEGESNRGIARRLFVSESTIERHVTTIFAKLSLGASRDKHRRVLAVLAYLRTCSA